MSILFYMTDICFICEVAQVSNTAQFIFLHNCQFILYYIFKNSAMVIFIALFHSLKNVTLLCAFVMLKNSIMKE